MDALTLRYRFTEAVAEEYSLHGEREEQGKNFLQAKHIYECVAALFESIGQVQRARYFLGRSSIALGREAFTSLEYDVAINHFERAQKRLRSPSPEEEPSREAQNAAGYAFFVRGKKGCAEGKYEDAVSFYRRSVRCFHGADNLQMRRKAEVHMYCYLSHLSLKSPSRGVQYLERAAELCRKHRLYKACVASELEQRANTIREQQGLDSEIESSITDSDHSDGY